mgnify:CR=1 FL=1
MSLFEDQTRRRFIKSFVLGTASGLVLGKPWRAAVLALRAASPRRRAHRPGGHGGGRVERARPQARRARRDARADERGDAQGIGDPLGDVDVDGGTDRE